MDDPVAAIRTENAPLLSRSERCFCKDQPKQETPLHSPKTLPSLPIEIQSSHVRPWCYTVPK